MHPSGQRSSSEERARPRRCALIYNKLILTILCGAVAVSATSAQETALDWSKEAQALYQAGHYAENADAYDASIAAGAVTPTTYYNAACSSARAGRIDAAFRWLDESIARGWQDVGHLEADTDLASLHADARWAPVVQRCAESRTTFIEGLKEPELHLELMEMKRIDQMIRTMAHQLAPSHGQSESGHDHDEEREGHGSGEKEKEHDHTDEGHVPHDGMHDVDAANTVRMKEIVDEYGWPTKSLVGEEGATAAWLLVQHADADPKFQRRCLELMKATPTGEVSTVNVAYLTDRVLVNEGKKQLYGTQFWALDGTMVPRPIEDEVNLEKRRAAAGMQPFSEYEKHMTGPHDH